MRLKIYQVDAFTQQPFHGNPAAVCILSDLVTDRWMQDVAREMNLSETAFLFKQTDGYELRWFTPAAEVDLCGHATLASAHILWETGCLPPGEQARFHTHSGLLTADRCGASIEMNFPATLAEAADPPLGLAQALGLPAGSSLLYTGRNRFDYLVEIENEAVLRDLKPDFGLLQQLPVRGTIVTCRSVASEYDFISRFFAPAVGVDEDPVTGSAHCCLGPYWQAKLGKSELSAYQASPRGGSLGVRVHGDRVILTGQAVTVMIGELL